jgi:hypothetical protein
MPRPQNGVDVWPSRCQSLAVFGNKLVVSAPAAAVRHLGCSRLSSRRPALEGLLPVSTWHIPSTATSFEFICFLSSGRYDQFVGRFFSSLFPNDPVAPSLWIRAARIWMLVHSSQPINFSIEHYQFFCTPCLCSCPKTPMYPVSSCGNTIQRILLFTLSLDRSNP